MSDMEKYKEYMDNVHAPERLYTEVLKMTGKKPVRHLGRRALILAVTTVLLIALGVAAVAASPFIFGWGGNFVVSTDGSSTEGELYIDNLTAPVEFVDGRMIFIVNGENIDITDKVSESKAFMYQFTDEEGVIHYWMVGKSGPEADNYGFGEFLYEPEGNWAGGYGSNHIGADGEHAQWFVSGKAELNVPW